MVYFIQAASGGPIKIGFTAGKSAKNRLANLQTAHPEKLLLLATTLHHKEADLHKRFDALRLHGEWFKASSGLMAWIQQNTLVTEDGHRQLSKASNWA